MSALRTLRLGLGLQLCGAALASAAEAPKPFTRDSKLPYHARWGQYSVSVVLVAEDRRRFRIADRAGNVLREVEASYVESVDYPDLSGRGRLEELRVVTHPLSNTLAWIRTYCFSRRDGRLRNILVMPYEFDRLRDLDRDGRPELLADSRAPLEWLDGLCHACCPTLQLVLQWDGERYVLANRRFPSLARSKAQEYRKEFLALLEQFNAPDSDAGMSSGYILGAALGYWANLATMGETAGQRRWVLAKLPPAWRDNFLEALPEVGERLRALPKQITVTQRRTIKRE